MLSEHSDADEHIGRDSCSGGDTGRDKGES